MDLEKEQDQKTGLVLSTTGPVRCAVCGFSFGVGLSSL